MTDCTAHRPTETPSLGRRIDPRHALIAAGLCWLGFALMVIMVESGHGTAFDAAGLEIWREKPRLDIPHGPVWLLEAVRDFTALGGALLRDLFALGAIVALLFLRLRREAALFGATILTGLLAELGLKALVGRPRPTIVPHLMEAGGTSFPSGHSFNSAVVYIAMALTFAAMSTRRSVRWTIIGSAVALTLLVALSRVWLGVHYPTDAIAGWLGGAGWAFLGSAMPYRPAEAATDG
jgi:undecaprenyl-diphosphatase